MIATPEQTSKEKTRTVRPLEQYLRSNVKHVSAWLLERQRHPPSPVVGRDQLCRSPNRVRLCNHMTAYDHCPLIGSSTALTPPHLSEAHLQFPPRLTFTVDIQRPPSTSSLDSLRRLSQSLPRHPTAIMSDTGDVEVESTAFPVLPKEVMAEQGSVKLFNKWSYEDVEIRDISLT